MNPMVYEEFRPSSRHFRTHRTRLLMYAWLPVATAIVLAFSKPPPGPGLISVTGLGIAGLLVFAALRRLDASEGAGPIARALAPRRDQWFPAVMVLSQNYFASLTICLLWFTMVDLGFSAGPLQHILLVAVLALSPLKRLLFGTYPAQPSPLREITLEFVRYSYAALFTLFLASVITRSMLPPGERLTTTLPPALIVIWVFALLVNITCVILFIDHLLRKMPPADTSQPQDVLD